MQQGWNQQRSWAQFCVFLYKESFFHVTLDAVERLQAPYVADCLLAGCTEHVWCLNYQQLNLRCVRS